MKRSIFIIVPILILVVSIIFIISANAEIPLKDACTFYNDAISKIDTYNIGYRITLKKETQIGDETFTEESVKTVYNNNESSVLSAYTDEQLLINGEAISIVEWFDNETLYSAVNGSYFSTPMTTESYKRRTLPFLLIDSALYNNILGVKHKDGYTVSFSEATANEAWLDADASSVDIIKIAADFSRNGNLEAILFDAQYLSETQNIRITITTEFLSESPKILPIDKSKARAISSVDLALQLERACCLILGADTITSHTKESIMCEVFGDIQTTETDITLDKENGWSSSLNTEISLANTGKTDNSSKITREETFKNGKHTLIINGIETTPEPEISEDSIKTNVRNMLVSAIMLPQDISSHQIIEKGSEITYCFIPTEELSTQLKDAALAALYTDSHILDSETEHYQLTEAVCYLTLDANTNIPKASGIRYIGTYTINGLSYTLEYTLHQEYKILV